MSDTIVAAATPLGVGAVGIVKLSGEKSIEVISKICKTRSGKEVSKLPNFKLTLCDIFDSKSGEALDEGLVVLMREPFSYTRENVAEIQVHSNPFIVHKIIKLCIENGSRLAEPGEFTKRAFLNGRIALSQAEAIAEIVKAQSDSALISSYRSLRGFLGEVVKRWQRKLVMIQAKIQVECDYSHDMDVDDFYDEILNGINTVMNDMKIQYDKSKKYQLVKQGLLVVICGRPNVGKSSLLNSIIGRDRSIVTPIPGTTRDAIEEVYQIDGFPLRFVDTAGIHDSDDYIEKMGIGKTKQYLEEAHLVIVIFDRSQEIQEEDLKIVELVKQKPHIIVLNKTDLKLKINKEQVKKIYPQEEIIEISTVTGTGLDHLIKKITEKIYWIKNDYNDSYYAINARQQEEIKKSIHFLEEALKSLMDGYPIDIISIDIDQALKCIKRINGEDVEGDIINKIFTSFCVGK